jgi:HEAT repeat protein
MPSFTKAFSVVFLIMNEKHINLLHAIKVGKMVIDHANVALLNELLITPGHTQHQLIAKILQDVKSPSTVPFVRKALESNFDYLEYTCSDSEAIAKWFSWLLLSIGTEDAVNLIKEYTQSTDEGIRKEMIYRLSKME